MERSNPDGIMEGPRLDELRARHPEFIRQMLVFGTDRVATRSELASTYAGWRGMERDGKGALHYSSNDIHNLFALVRSIPGVAEDSTGRRFTGVGVDESAADDLLLRREGREDSAVSQQKRRTPNDVSQGGETLRHETAQCFTAPEAPHLVAAHRRLDRPYHRRRRR